MWKQYLLEPSTTCCLFTVLRDMLFSVGVGYVWYENNVNETMVLLQVRRTLNDIFIQNMSSFFPQ